MRHRIQRLIGANVIGGGAAITEVNAVCPTITPTLGTEKLNNPGAEGTFTDGLAANWTKAGTPTVAQETTIKRTGNNSQSVNSVINNGVYNASWVSGVTVINTWYRVAGWLYVTSGTPRTDQVDGANLVGVGATVAATSTWTESFHTGRALKAGADGPYMRSFNGASVFYADDLSVKDITFSTCLSLLGSIPRADTTYICTPTSVIGAQVGMVIHYLDASNFVMAILNRATDKAELLKCVAGTWTSIINTAVTYSAGAQLKVIQSGTTYQLFYNGSQVGTNQTIADTLGAGVYGFSTDAGATVGTVTTNPT